MVPIPGNCCAKSEGEKRTLMDRNNEDSEFLSGVVEGIRRQI